MKNINNNNNNNNNSEDDNNNNYFYYKNKKNNNENTLLNEVYNDSIDLFDFITKFFDVFDHTYLAYFSTCSLSIFQLTIIILSK